MNEYLIAERYARALSASVDKDEDLDPVQEELRAVGTLLEKSAKLQASLNTPSLPMDVRAGILEKVLEKAVEFDVTQRFMLTLLKRGRISLLPHVTRRFSMAVDLRLNRVTADVTSAMSLTPKQKKEIHEGLEEYCRKTVRVETRVDPDIIGGVVVHVDGKILDGSLRARLAQLRKSLLQEEM